MTSGTDFHMGEATGSQTFEEIVKWAYGTLPQKIRDLPDFPGIQVVDEPPADVLKSLRATATPHMQRCAPLQSWSYQKVVLTYHVLVAGVPGPLIKGDRLACSARGALRIIW
jgi:hypothetical protein